MKTIELFQWDLNKQIPCSFPEAHFACVGSEDALIVKANGGNVSIPNILLQEGKDIMVWMMEDGAVADSGRIRIVTRAKPADYIYTETEVITFESLVAKVEDVIAKGNTATDSATTAAQKADAAANKANAASDKAAQVEAEIKASEARRVEAEQGRAEAEATRAANETKRTESFNTNLVSWNSKVDAACKKATDTASKAAQDAKTATDAAIAKTEEATQAAVAKADKATASATTAANKAESAVAQLPIPSGNVLKGEAESTFINLHDSWKAPILNGKVLGQSNQTTTLGVNMIEHAIYKVSDSQIVDVMPDGIALEAGDYIASFKILGDKTPNGMYVYEFGTNTKLHSVLSSTSISFKLSEPKSVYFKIYAASGLKPEDILITQLEKGTKAHKPEPYTGGKPSPSPDYPQEITNLTKAELVVAGKNLADVNESNNVNFTLRREPLPAGTYTFSCDKGRDSGFFFNVKALDDSGTATHEITMSKTSPCTFTISEPTALFINGWGLNAPYVIGSIQLEAGSKATAYEPTLEPKATPIDLQGNELCSLPNGIKDEVVIDAEGNVSLIKRVAKIDASTVNLKFMQKQNNNKWLAFNSFPEITSGGETKGAISSKFIHKYMLEDGAQYGNFTITTDGNLCFGIPESLCPKEGDWASVTPEVNAWFDGLKEGLFIYASYKKPQTITLGKVELPALPEATSNVWNDGNIPANVYIKYLKDVNIAYSDLENQIKQITAALSVMDTPTVIPEMAWGTPAAI